MISFNHEMRYVWVVLFFSLVRYVRITDNFYLLHACNIDNDFK